MPHDEPSPMLMTMVAAIAAGVMLMVVARRLRVPALVVLLAGGIALGPSGLGFVRPESLGDGLLVLVAMAVGLILFEGGLTLDVTGYRSAPRMIKRLLTVGVIATWLGTALVVWLVGRQPVSHAVVAGSLVIVTGPTVIAPMLKRIRVQAKLHSILHWEAVFIDPIGVFIAVLCFEWIAGPGGGSQAVVNLLLRIAAGLAIGAAGGVSITLLVRRRLIPEDMVNVFALAGAVLVFGLGEMVRSETGLLAVTVAGFVFGLSGSFRLKAIRAFKAELTDLLIGTLFILLAARLTFDQFKALGVAGVAAVVIVAMFVRPLSILLCSWGVDLSLREKLFLGWVGPRGIVAASMASLVAIHLEGVATVVDPKFVETFTYSVIIVTIVVQGSTAGRVARSLGLTRPAPTGWLVIGAHTLGRRLARFIRQTAGLDTVLVDTNAGLVHQAREDGFVVINDDARDTSLRDHDELQGIGNVLALTDNEDLNARLCLNWSDVVGEDHVFRCNTTGVPPDDDPEHGRVLWSELPRPSRIVAEMARGESAVFTMQGPPSTTTRFATPLATWTDGRLALDPGIPAVDAERPADPEARTVYLRRAADSLRRSLHPDLVVTLDDVPDPATLFRVLLDQIVAIAPALPRDEIEHDLIDAERRLPSALGSGVAVPHAYCTGIDARICAIARVPNGVDFAAHDGEPVRLVFLILSPQGDPAGHLATLADIAQRVADEDIRDRLMTEPSPEEVIRIVHESR